MARRIALTFTENATTAEAVLLGDQAPKTCEAIWQALERPAVGPSIHAMYCGRELIFGLPNGNQHALCTDLPPENQVLLPSAGDVCFKYFRPNEINKPGADHAHDVGFFDLMVFYGRNARLFSSQGWVPSNLFASIDTNLDAFAEMCARVHREGIKELRIERSPDRPDT